MPYRPRSRAILMASDPPKSRRSPPYDQNRGQTEPGPEIRCLHPPRLYQDGRRSRCCITAPRFSHRSNPKTQASAGPCPIPHHPWVSYHRNAGTDSLSGLQSPCSATHLGTRPSPWQARWHPYTLHRSLSARQPKTPNLWWKIFSLNSPLS